MKLTFEASMCTTLYVSVLAGATGVAVKTLQKTSNNGQRQFLTMLINELILLFCTDNEMHHWSSFYHKWSTKSIMTYVLYVCM